MDLQRNIFLEDGIDQGETLSPLWWRIFYDPLLSKLNSTEKGYKMKVNKPINTKNKTYTQLEQKISNIVYMDDTTLIGENKDDIQHLLGIASSFYTLNKIGINAKKTKL